MNYLLNYDVKHKFYSVKKNSIFNIPEFNNQQIFPKSSYGSFLRKASDNHVNQWKLFPQSQQARSQSIGQFKRPQLDLRSKAETNFHSLFRT